MISKIIAFIKNKHSIFTAILWVVAILLYFLICYWVSLLNDSTLMLSIAHRNKILAKRVAVLSAQYVHGDQDIQKHICIKENLAMDLSLLSSSSKAVACAKRAGRMASNNLDDKINFLNTIESISKIDNYIIHGDNLLNSPLDPDNKDLIYILENIKGELLTDLEKVINLEQNGKDNFGIIVKNTEKLFSLIIWLIVIFTIFKYANLFKIKNTISKILIAEDNRVNAEIIKKIIEDQDYHVVIANDGQEVLDILQYDRNFAIIFMDCEMPVMDGLESTANIRRDEKEQGLTRIPIIALTANVMEGYRERCLAIGMDDYLPKPITKSEVTNMIKKWGKRNKSSGADYKIKL